MFPRKMITLSSKGRISINSKAEILDRCREADYRECLINAYSEMLEINGILIQSPDFILIDLDVSLCKTCVYPIRKLDYLLEQTLTKIKKEISGQPTVLWTGSGYHIYLPVKVQILDTEVEFSKRRYPNLFSGISRYSGYYVSEVFMQFAERCLVGGKFDPSHQHRYSDSMVRIPGTYNMDSQRNGISIEKSRVKILKEWDGDIIDINPLVKKFQIWLGQQ